ncbi:hypothetical protein BDV26DRAFT_286366 [Aspergillus bertholletiae]|uniref:Protein kinase domain-containing protein n=1 Tax=Aspergillus bertholletiae TaxID=1226010 RepID=A0A5N7ASR7_9EURO|nr:hypothetical protein BDV26DRAFT_286366 [Aspergillus bertholletiae]
MSYFFQHRKPSPIIKLDDGHEIITTEVEQLDPCRTVYRLKLEPGSYRHTIPTTATSVIVKQQKEGWEEEFEDEVTAYNKLNALQGKVIPYFYGQGYFDGLPALILSDINGNHLHILARSNDKVPEDLEAQLRKVFNELSKFGALYTDQKLDTFLLCVEKDRKSSKVMVVDLEQVEFPDQLRSWHKFTNQEGPRSLMEDFKYTRNPRRQSSPLDFWISGNDNSASTAS